MTDEKVTAAKRLEAIGLNDPTVAALLKELKENAITKSDAEPPKEVRAAWQHYYHDAPVDFDPVAEEIFEAGWKAALARSDAEPQDSDGVTRKDVDSWMRYFDEHAEEFVAAHAAIIRKAAQNG